MIHIDPRAGSGPLLPLFLSHRYRPLACHSPLLAADFAFIISGPSGPTLCGIERKTLPDLIASIRSQRLSGEQIPKLLDHYAPHVYLVIEGFYRVNWETGYMEWHRRVNGEVRWVPILCGKHPFLASEMDNMLSTVVERTPIKVWKTRDEKETVDWVVQKERWGEKDWGRHQAHMGIHVPAPYVGVGKASDVRRFAYGLDGVGWERSGAVEGHFKTVEEAVMAPVEEWQKVPGFGRVLSNKIWHRLRGKTWKE